MKITPDAIRLLQSVMETGGIEQFSDAQGDYKSVFRWYSQALDEGYIESVGQRLAITDKGKLAVFLNKVSTAARGSGRWIVVRRSDLQYVSPTQEIYLPTSRWREE